MFHLERPQNFTSMSRGAICFLECQGKFLLLKRAPHVVQGGVWTAAPGGKLEAEESPLQAAVRELREETGITLPASGLRFLHTVYFQFPDIEYELSLFYTSIDERPPVVLTPHEHTEYAWATLEETLQKPLMRGGAECISLLRSALA